MKHPHQTSIPLAALLFLTLRIFLLPSAPLSAAPSEEKPRYYHAAQVRPGGIAAIAASEAGEFTAKLFDSSGELHATAPSFTYTGEAAAKLEVALLSLSSQAAEGEYSLRLFRADSKRELYRSPLEVVSREFRTERIPLRAKLTALRSEPDPRKRRQALEIQRLYARFDADALHDASTWSMPVEWRRISSYYGDRRVYEYSDGKTARTIHTGLDLAADTGTPIRSPAAGKVLMARDRIISGKSVVIEHMPGVYSVLFHLHTLEVSAGEKLGKGELIGTVGMSGLATGPHLHWEIRVNGTPVAPRELTKRGLIGMLEATGAIAAPQ